MLERKQRLEFFFLLRHLKGVLSLDGKRFETVDVGTSLERVLRYYTLNGKLTKVRNGVCVGIGVNPALKAIGIKDIEIDFKNAHVAFIFAGT